MANYYYKQKYKRLKRNNKCFIWSKMFLISVFLWCVTSSSNLFWTFDHKLDTALPPKSPNDHQFRFHQCPLSHNSLRRSRMDTRGLPGVVLWRGKNDSPNSQVFNLPSLMKIQNGYQRSAWGSFMKKVELTVQIHQRLLISEYLYWVTSFRNSIHDHTLKATQMTMAN